MAQAQKLGILGLSLPNPTLEKSERLEMTPASVMAWRNRLPMADTGATANQVYYALCDCNKVAMPLQDRFQILELFRTPVQFICQSLRKHYLNQSESLTEKKLTIIKLAQTLQLEMANGYKLIIDELATRGLPTDEENKKMMLTSLERVMHYFNHILLRCYHLYSNAPLNLWKECYILYQFAEEKRLLDHQEFTEAFKHILVMAATDPYKWRQSEQDALFNATHVWAKKISIQSNSSNNSPGEYLFEFGQDKLPFPPTTSKIIDAQKCRTFDLTPNVTHLKTLLAIVEPDELHARMEHSNDPEYAISLPVLQGIIQEWETLPIRSGDRTTLDEPVRICIGLSAIHYFLNDEHSFQTMQQGDINLSVLPTLSIQEENVTPNVSGNVTSNTLSNPINMNIDSTESNAIPINNATNVNLTQSNTIDDPNANIPKSSISLQSESAKKKTDYPIYDAQYVNESAEGYCLIWKNTLYPPIQAGDLLGLCRQDKDELNNLNETTKKQWEIVMVRWLKHPTPSELKIGIRKIAQHGTAAAAQIIKNGKPAGYYLRCLLLDTGILTPTLPFKPGSDVLIMRSDNSTTDEIELTKLRSATGTYKLFDYKSKGNANISNETFSNAAEEHKDINSVERKQDTSKKDDEPFDSIWSNL